MEHEMGTPMTLLASTTTNQIDNEITVLHRRVIDGFHSVVADIRSLIEDDAGYVCHEGISHGKDSTLVALCLIEAYRQSINEGKIEANRPLIMSTVNPKAESLPMQMYSEFAAPYLQAYADQLGINLWYDTISPDFHDEYACRYLSAQKIIQNASMSGDCTVILKTSVSEKYIKGLLKRFETLPGMEQYVNSPVISLSGSRSTDESSRRSMNMAKQGTAQKTVEELKGELKTQSALKTSYRLFQYAPIRDWVTDEVFTALELAGEKPLTRNMLGIQNPIPGFMSDFALLLAIYGNAAQDACEIAIGQKEGAGCSGKARYGCLICTQVGTIDKTQTSLAKQERWNILGQEEALRLRDFMFRLSTDMKARALHAKAYDKVTFGRIAMQPNVLKPRYLEKLVRLFAQLSIISERRAADFRELIAQGKTELHPGMIEIQQDPTLNAKARRRYLQMYKEQAQKPQIKIFSERHAIYLSYRWGMDGIACLPFRPLAVWRDLNSDEKAWIPFPKTNAEWESETGKKIKLVDPNYPLPEAIMMPVFKYEEPEHYVENYQSLLSFWKRPADTSDITLEQGFNNCTLEKVSKHGVPVKTEANISMSINEIEKEGDGYKIMAFLGDDEGPTEICNVQFSTPVMGKVWINGKVAPKSFTTDYEKSTFSGLAESRIRAVMDSLTEKIMETEFSSLRKARQFVERTLASEFPSKKPTMLAGTIPFLRIGTLGIEYKAKSRQAGAKLHFTKRVTRKKAGKLERGNTRMKFYPMEPDSRLHDAHVNPLDMFEVDFTSHYEKAIFNQHELINADGELFDGAKIAVTEQSVEMFKTLGGMKEALELHDSYLRKAIKRREPVRQFISTCAAEILNAQGGVLVSPSYINTYRELLKRTQLFAEIGALDFQAKSAEEIAQQPWAITMKQHRKDKIAVLNMVRKLRVRQRNRIKAELSGVDVESRITAQVNRLFDDAENNLVQGVNALCANIFNSQFDTHEISLAQRATTHKTWLLLNQEALTTFDGLKRHALTPAQRHFLSLDAKALSCFGTLVERRMKKIAEIAGDTMKEWLPLKQSIIRIRKDIAHAEQMDTGVVDIRGDALEAFWKVVETQHPHTPGALFEPDARHMKPNLNNLKVMLDKQIKRTKEVMNWVTELSTQAESESRSLKRRTLAKVDLSSRLQFVSDVSTDHKAKAAVEVPEKAVVAEDDFNNVVVKVIKKNSKSRSQGCLESMLAFHVKQAESAYV